MSIAYVMDTSYLSELLAVPGYSKGNSVEEIRMRYELAVKKGSRIYVPIPCIYELGKHIASARNGRDRRKLAAILHETVKSSLLGTGPWTIIPSAEAQDIAALVRLCGDFATNYAQNGVSLTDTTIIREAQRLKRRYTTLGQVHIWTTDGDLKAREPDIERDPFLG